MTSQPPRFRPSALRVAAHDQRMAPLGWSNFSAKVQSAYSTTPADNEDEDNSPNILSDKNTKNANMNVLWKQFLNQ